MEELKVGDKVYLKTIKQYSSETKNYLFSEVSRVTKTQAILANGLRLKKEPVISYYSSSDYYIQVGDIHNNWKIATDEVLAEYKKWSEESKIKDWWNNKVFTIEEKEQIYYYFQITLNKPQ